MRATKLRAPARLLSNGHYAVLASPNGGGMAALDGFALTRWSPDPVRDAAGTFMYLRDVETSEFWSVTRQPAGRSFDAHHTALGSGTARYAATHTGITSRLEIAVVRDSDVELRRLTLANDGAHARRIEITTYAEVVLNTPAADAAHPAFSKLFVQTAYDDARQALVAWRRLRSPGDRPLWFGHRLVGASDDPPQYETDRARFLGRGRSPAQPCALTGDAELSATVGNVLDPMFALRRVVTLLPGESASLCAVYTAAPDRNALRRLLDSVPDGAAAAALLAETAPAEPDAMSLLGLPGAWLDELDVDGDWSAFAPAQHADRSALPRASAASHSTRVASDSRAAPASMSADEELRFFNGHGGFSADGSEYVIHVPCDADGAYLPPQPWVNVIANEHGGLFVSERGAAHTWSVNSRENRITPWSNDPVADPHGEAFYIRDDAAGTFHSLTPGPVPAAGVYHVHHGFGYTRFEFANDDVAHELTLFMAPDETLRVARLAVTNHAAQPRTLSVHAYAQLVLGVEPAATRRSVEVEHDAATGALLARNCERGAFSERIAFAAAVAANAERSVSADRAAFLGRGGDVGDPAALRVSVLDGNVDVADPCAALQLKFRLEAGETAHCAFLLGESAEAGAARTLVHRYDDVESVDEALVAVRERWRGLLSGVVVETPVPELDLVVNGWLSYQNLSCRMWGRSAFYQSGGAFGFRDQLQDSAALLYLDPGLARRQIVLHAEHQFEAGDVLHWWHPPTSRGMRTRFADDLLWLPHVAAFYVRSTGDDSVFDESARFLTARPLAEGEDEVLLTPEDSGTSGTVFEHCCRSIDRSLTRGVHGLPLIGVGDWNDGMNRVGREGRGESVWLGFFLYDILHDFIPLCEQRGEPERAVRYREYQHALGHALNDGGWDGAWYRRAYYDDGTPIGAAASAECRIDTIAQAWAVLSGAAPEDRGRRALDAMEEHLVAEQDGIIRLLTPAFDRTPHDPGYIKGYLPGVRENGGQYTHGALWAVRALAQAGRRERAAHLLTMLSPVRRGGSTDAIATYRTEPYVIAADVYGVEPHIGRGGWTWYTGSAGWMFRVALESILGFSLNGGGEILLRPCVPTDWRGFRIRYRLPDGATRYDFDVVQTPGAAMTSATLDGTQLTVRAGALVIPLVRDGAAHQVRVDLGTDVGPRYVPRPA